MLLDEAGETTRVSSIAESLRQDLVQPLPRASKLRSDLGHRQLVPGVRVRLQEGEEAFPHGRGFRSGCHFYPVADAEFVRLDG